MSYEIIVVGEERFKKNAFGDISYEDGRSLTRERRILLHEQLAALKAGNVAKVAPAQSSALQPKSQSEEAALVNNFLELLKPMIHSQIKQLHEAVDKQPHNSQDK